MKPSFFCLILLAACLDAQVAAPHIGLVRYPGLPIQDLLGVPANFIPAPTAFSTADAASFSDIAGLLAANGQLRLVNRNGTVLAHRSYPGSTPLLNIDREPDTAIAWLPDAHTLVHFNGHDFTPVVVPAGAFDGIVSSVSAPSAGRARLLVSHPDHSSSAVTVSLATGDILSVSLLPGVQGPAFEVGSFTLSAGDKTLEIDAPAGVHYSLPLPGKTFTAERMSSRWVHLFIPSAGVHCALRLSPGEPALYRLPVPVRSGASR
jgi:hypothetical protein